MRTAPGSTGSSHARLPSVGENGDFEEIGKEDKIEDVHTKKYMAVRAGHFMEAHRPYHDEKGVCG